MAFSEFPKMMRHPSHRPAVISKDEYVNNRVIKAPPGSPEKFPSVYVNNADQEAQYAAEGYLPNGISDPVAYYRTQVGADNPNDHSFKEFPKWLYKPISRGEHEARLFNSQEDQDRIPEGEAWYATPGDAIEASRDDEEAVSIGQDRSGDERKRR